ncbi:MAG TPA: anthranilate phosphoribosyltransferase [Steroidobacteraceae bacterium]|nr:anthranilate phosphoribosyltransferase [Steroidobacteraceae bacterium]
MSAHRELLERLLGGGHLDEDEAADLLRLLTDPALPPAVGGALLAALRAKGIRAEEVRGFAKAMRALARRPVISPGAPLVDMVGTGGDGSGSFNLSTGAALLAAALGQRVVKHGNRSISSRCGSADILEGLGLRLPLDEAGAGECLDATGFTFLFAPHFHPAMKAIAPVRQALGVRTVFNILGPLTNPAEPPYHLIGAYDLEVAELIAGALAGLPLERAYVVHGEPGWDEATPVGPFTLFEVTPGAVTQRVRDPEEFGLARCSAEAVKGGDAAYNAACLRDVFAGRDRGAHRDALVLGAALVLELTGTETAPLEAAARAAEAIDSGAAARVIERIADFGERRDGR